MHLIKDENGNMIHHGHEHTHEHTHADGVIHTHNHSHEEGESHEHSHGDISDDTGSKNKSLTLMRYMLDHNVHHAEELALMAAKMNENESVEKAVMDAVEDFRRGNEKLRIAVELMEKNGSAI